MRQEVEVFDLGVGPEAVLDPRKAEQTVPVGRRPRSRPETVRQSAGSPLASTRVRQFKNDLLGTLAIFLPGASQLIQKRFALGLFFLSVLGFLCTLAWALLNTIDRLAITLNLLGSSVLVVFWVLGVAYVAVAALHLSSVWTATENFRPRARHPAVGGIASLIVPGWGQILNGDRLRAVLFLGCVWLSAGFWVAAATPTTELFNTYLPAVSPWEQAARAPIVLWTARWTVPLVICCLAVYDAVSSAIDRRRKG